MMVLNVRHMILAGIPRAQCIADKKASIDNSSQKT